MPGMSSMNWRTPPALIFPDHQVFSEMVADVTADNIPRPLFRSSSLSLSIQPTGLDRRDFAYRYFILCAFAPVTDLSFSVKVTETYVISNFFLQTFLNDFPNCTLVKVEYTHLSVFVSGDTAVILSKQLHCSTFLPEWINNLLLAFPKKHDFVD